MSDSIWSSILKTVAPILGSAIGGPFGGLAAKALVEGLGGDENTTESQMQEMVENASPETLLKIKEIEAGFKIKMKELGIKEKDLNVQDRNSARTMGMNTTLFPQMIISSIFVLTFAIIMYVVFSGTLEMSVEQKTITSYMLGILSAGIIQIMNFWFGSSSGSKEKDTPKL